MKVRKTNTILLPLESYLYLQNKSHLERCGKNHTEKQIERLKRNFDDFSYGTGYKKLYDGDLGGCSGHWKNGYKERRWTSWSCEDMKRILDNAGLPYKDGKQAEVIEVSI